MKLLNKLNIDSRNFELSMFFCACCYPLFKYSYRELGDIFQTILILGSLLHIYKYRGFFIKDKMVICLLISIILTISSWLASKYYIPELAKETPKLSVLSKLFFFIIIAYWLKGIINRVYIFLSCYLIGLILLFISHSTDSFISETILGLHGKRIDYGVVNANHPAVLSGIACIICIFYSIKTIYFAPKTKYLLTLPILLISITFLAYFSFVVLATQSRQVWLAIPTSFFASSLAYCLIKKTSKSTTVKIILSTAMIITTVLYLTTKVQYVENRSDKEKNVISVILSGDIENLPYTSIGIRVHFWLEAKNWIEKNPFFGYGEEARGLVISQSKSLPNYIKSNFSHLHNSYIELLVQYGLFSLILFIYIYLSLVNGALKNEKTGEVFYLSLLFFIFWAITNNFESYTLQKTGEIISNIFFAIFYTFTLSDKFNTYSRDHKDA